MRLINVNTGALEQFHRNPPSYAILSHTWAPDEEELLYDDMIKGETSKSGIGKVKLEGCCKKAKEDGLDYVWIDTCCINRANATELGEAINSMFRWYQASQTCYAYLVDVDEGHRNFHDVFRASRWFQRGWTLQELLAPKDVVFYDKCWQHLGSKHQLAGIMEEVTGIPRPFLTGLAGLPSASVAQRMSWAANRTTTREEDIAYCLLGIFNVMIPMIYGEGKQAFTRLQEQIMKKTPDDSILAWGLATDSAPCAGVENGGMNKFEGILAVSPAAFQDSGMIVFGGTLDATGILGGFLHAKLGVHTAPDGQTFGLLKCRPRDSTQKVVGVPLCRVNPGEDSDEYLRPQGRKASLLFTSSTNTSNETPKAMRILESLQFDDRIAFDRRHGFCIEEPSNGKLFLVDVFPQERWEKESSFILTGADFSRDAIQQTWLKFRHTESPSDDFVIALELEIRDSQPKAQCHVMTASRQTTLGELAMEPSITKYVFGNIGAHTEHFNLQTKLTQEQFGSQPIFMVRMYSMDFPSGVTVDASLELQLIDRGVQLKRILKEDKHMRHDLRKLPGSMTICEKKAAVDKTTAQLKAVQEDLDRLQHTKDELLINLKSDKQELDSLLSKNQALIEREKEIFEFVSSAGALPSHCGSDRASHWFQGIAEYLLSSAPTTETTITEMPDIFQRAFMQNVAYGHLAAMRFLAEIHTNVACKTTCLKGVGTLSVAIAQGDRSAASWLLDQGIAIDEEEGDGFTPLYRATWFKDKAAVEWLLNRGASIDAASSGSHQRTPLVTAACENDFRICQLLIDRGANVNSKDEFGVTALAFAAWSGSLTIANLLIEAGADVDPTDIYLGTPLGWAARQGHNPVVQMLLEHLVNMETANKIEGTPLMQAVIHGHETTAKLLLEKGANANAQDKDGLTSLFIAIRRRQTSLVRILIDHGADIDVKSNDGMNPLYYAIRQKHKDSVRLLVDRGADTSKINKLPAPLQYAKDLMADEDAAGNSELDGVGQVAILKSIVKILEKSTKQGKTGKSGKHASTKSTRHAN